MKSFQHIPQFVFYTNIWSLWYKVVTRAFIDEVIKNSNTMTRGVATLGSSRHVPTHNFHKILRKICIKWNVYIFLVFNVFSKIRNKIVLQFNLSSYTAIINAIQTAVIDQFIALKNRKMNLSEANQNKIVFSCRILQFLLFDLSRILIKCSVSGFY